MVGAQRLEWTATPPVKTKGTKDTAATPRCLDACGKCPSGECVPEFGCSAKAQNACLFPHEGAGNQLSNTASVNARHKEII